MSAAPLMEQHRKLKEKVHSAGLHLSSRRDLPQADVGTDQRVVEEEDFSLLRSENLTFVIKSHFGQQLRVNQMFLA